MKEIIKTLKLPEGNRIMENNINSSDLYLRLLEETEPIKELTENTQQFRSFYLSAILTIHVTK